MKIRARVLRGVVATPLAALLFVLSVSVPVLERAEVGHDPVMESAHDPATCPPAHDHTVCTQMGANLAALSVPHPDRAPHASVRGASPATASIADDSAYTQGPPSRAPPSV